MQGHSAPWCVGSVFFPPHLLDHGVGPARFNQVGKPLCLLSSGLVLEEDEASVAPEEQIQDFVERVAGPFVPRGLLTNYVHSEETTSNDSGKRGNLLQGLKCGDGRVVLFFLCEDTYRVASTVCYQGSCGSWYVIQSLATSQHADDSGLARWPVSVVLQHSVYQLSAVWAHSLEKKFEGTAIVAVRCKYQVYFITVLRQEDQVQLFTSAVSKFRVPVAHVAWNPHVCEEAAVILESGEVHLLDVTSVGNLNGDRAVDLLAKLIVRSPVHRNIDLSMPNDLPAGSATDKSKSNSNQIVYNVRSTTESLRRPDLSSGFSFSERRNSLDVSVHGELQADHHDERTILTDLETGSADRSVKRQEGEQLWWRCEYGWLLQTLLVANSNNVYLVNLADKKNDLNFTSGSFGQLATFAEEFTGVDVVASVRASEYLRFCFHRSRSENILAFGKCENAGVHEFSVATEKHVTLFDVRQPCTPILQWEHGMNQDPPNLLIMYPLAELRSFDTGDQEQDFRKGRVIFAANFRSGDIRVFCYGHKSSQDDKTVKVNSKRHTIDARNWIDTIYAWDTPSRLYAPLSNVEDWAEIVSSSCGLHSKSQAEFAFKSRNEGQNIAGLVLLPKSCFEVPKRSEKQCEFALLQLTGWGELLIQTYEASDDLKDPPRASVPSTNFPLGKTEIEPEFGCQEHRLYYESMPTFLKYMRTGSILAPYFSKSTTESRRVASTMSASHREGALARIQMSKKARRRAYLRCDPEILINNLMFPLSMYEVAQRALSMELPKALAPFVAPLPSDLNMVGNRFPSISPLLRATALAAESTKEDNGKNLTLLRNFEFEGSTLRGTIPLPLLLELQSINRVDQHGSSALCQLGAPGSERGEFPVSNNQEDHDKQIDAPFVDGEELLIEGSLCIETVLKELISKGEPLVISLDDPVQDLEENAKLDGQCDSRVLLYNLSDRGLSGGSDTSYPPSRNATGDFSTAMDVGKSYQSGDLEDVELSSGDSDVHIHHKFATRGTSSCCTKDRDKMCLAVDPKLCPIELSFTHPGEELEQDELVALDDLQSDFLQWQRGFSPYRRSF